MQLSYLARQPILDADEQPVGYELLYRAGPEGGADGVDDDAATMSVLGNAIVEFGLTALVGESRAFVNVAPSFFERGLHRALEPERVVFEVHAGLHTGPRALDLVRAAAEAGYVLAVDDYGGDDASRALVEYAAFAKLDLAVLTSAELAANVDELGERGLTLVAEKVETPEDFERCRAMGFDLFQGYFFERPTVLSRATVTPDRLAASRLLAELLRPDAEIADLAAVIGRDVGLTYRVLRVVNSGFHGLSGRVESVERAIALLGLDNLRNLASLMTLTRVEGKSPELMTTASVRARMCEALARSASLAPDLVGGAFLAGLLSVLGGLMDTSVEDIVEDLPLAEPVEEALLGRTGVVGDILAVVEAYERDDVGRMLLSEFSPQTLATAYLEAMSWALEMRQTLATV